MEALRVEQVLERDGELDVRGFPYKKGQRVEIIVLPQSVKRKRPRLNEKHYQFIHGLKTLQPYLKTS